MNADACAQRQLQGAQSTHPRESNGLKFETELCGQWLSDQKQIDNVARSHHLVDL